jgi:GNAT superfamily N-acetyltransferase
MTIEPNGAHGADPEAVPGVTSGRIRICADGDRSTILAIINAAAVAYRGVIPADRWHEPYMSAAELDAELAAGVVFSGEQADQQLRGVMGIQDVADVQLIRHAYVAPAAQGRGIGGALLQYLMRDRTGPVLVGTWAAAQWAIAFYLRHGFEQTSNDEKTRLLQQYWTIPERQIETSVVLRRD